MFDLTLFQFLGLLLFFFFVVPAWVFVIAHTVAQGFYRGKNHIFNIFIKESLKDVKK